MRKGSISYCKERGVRRVKEGLVILMATALVFAFAGVVLAAPEGNIEPSVYDLNAERNSYGPKDWREKEQGEPTGRTYTGFGDSTHIYGTWNSPYAAGVDGYNYNDAQDYTDNGDQVLLGGKMIYTSGPHGGYLTTSHRCRECHAVHRAAGKFKLTRSDTRFEACDWCHGTGAGSGFNIQMDNDDDYTREYNVGHTMGFGIDTGKWKAPDDTYPAFTPNYWLGGFSCFDCHSPHANPQRILGYNDDGDPVGIESGGKVYGIANPGHDVLPDDPTRHPTEGSVYLSGSWLLIKNADREIATDATTAASGIEGDGPVSIAVGSEIPDIVTGALYEYSGTTSYPVNKIPVDWNNPVGLVDSSDPDMGFNKRNIEKPVWSVSEFCTDCHDGNAGLHTEKAPLFSEDRALRDVNDTVGNPKNAYDPAYGHDVNSRHCDRQMKFDPEDEKDFGPNCRNCHKGSSACNTCHQEPKAGYTLSTTPYTSDDEAAADNSLGLSTYYVYKTSTGQDNLVAETALYKFFKQSHTVVWDPGWRTSEEVLDPTCSDDGFSWPHRTLGWKMLKDDLFGLGFDGTEVSVGDSRTYSGASYPVHDLDSVCLDCHNPIVWNATSMSHVDDPENDTDNYNDELLTRGLP